MDRTTLVLATISAILIGVGLAFTGAFSSHNAGAQQRMEPGVVKAADVPQSTAPAAPAAPTTAENIKTQVQQLISARNRALTTEDWEALARISVPDSPARAADDQLRDWLIENGVKVEKIETEILEIAELTALSTGKLPAGQSAVLVRSTQKTADIAGPAAIKAAQNKPQCTIWIMAGNKISRFEPCPEAQPEAAK
ncbi:MAG: hypothetical protein Q4E03_03810 [Trueperella sp.]|nr:hypothetical protein [Trueperella sp.]